MSLLRKTVFNMTKIDAEDDLKRMIDSCLKHLGENLYEADLKRKEENQQEGTMNLYELDFINFSCIFGKEISINTKCIDYEEESFIPEEDYKLTLVASSYMIKELGKIVSSRMKEYKNFIQKLLEEAEHTKIEFKIIQIGEQQYYLYSI